MEKKPTVVPNAAKQVGDIRAKWPWTEPSVWTDRMLTALEEGVKGGKWFSLIDKVYNRNNLESAFGKVKAKKGSAGIDHQSIEMFEIRLEENLDRLQQELREGIYHPQAIRRVWIPKPGSKEKRPLGIPTIRDRVVQTALRQVLEPVFERDFAEHSYGFRPEHGCKDALRRVDSLLWDGYYFVVDADIKGFFDNIPQEGLMDRMKEKVTDGRILDLVEAYLKHKIMDGLKEWNPIIGTPQGAVISPLLANIYLNPLDNFMAGKGFHMVRYADDFVILCQNQWEANQALELIRQWMSHNNLTLHPDKTKIVNANDPGGFEFLGYRFERGRRWPRDKSLKKLKDSIRRKTRRTDGRSLPVIISDVNRTVRGWFGYFKHAHQWTFPRIDRWIRMRLRSILRKRSGRRGRGRGADHQRWPNVFFANLGLFSCAAAHESACQSAQR